MKITLITPGVTPYVMGGMQRHSFNLARHLARLGVEIDLYHTDFKEAEVIDGLVGMSDDERRNITSISLPWPKGDRLPGHYIRDLKRFSASALAVYRERQPADFIISKSLTGWSFVEDRKRGGKLPPVAVNLHGYEMYQPPASFRSRLEGAMMRPAFQHHILHADFAFSYGGKITELLRNQIGIPSERILEIPGGVDQDWLAKEPSPVQPPRRFIFLGRYERRKGIEELHDVIAANPHWAERAQFRFVGPIPEDKRLSLRHVSYSGSISDPVLLRQELHASDVLLCPSHSEGMPNSILEGMASGLAVIATDVGAVRLMVSKDNGILLPSPTTAALASAIERMIETPVELMGALKEEALAKSRAFSWCSIARQTLGLISAEVRLNPSR